jgi:hypothetical protein
VRDLLVSNTGPLIAPALIDRLDFLRSLLKALSVPETVRAGAYWIREG